MSCIARAADGIPGPHVYGFFGYCAFCREPDDQRRQLDKALRDLKAEIMRPVEWLANQIVRLMPAPKNVTANPDAHKSAASPLDAPFVAPEETQQ